MSRRKGSQGDGEGWHLGGGLSSSDGALLMWAGARVRKRKKRYRVMERGEGGLYDERGALSKEGHAKYRGEPGVSGGVALLARRTWRKMECWLGALLARNL